jgi:hypothetical protein
MQSSIVFCLLVGSLISVHASVPAKRSCDPTVFENSKCNLGISYDRSCKSMKLNLGKNAKIKLCSTVNIFWSYPTNNLTLVIETSFTSERQPFRIRLSRKQLKPQISYVYRVVKRQVTELKPSNRTSVVKSDSQYRVMIKFQAPSKLQYYGVFIKYDVLKG